MNSLPKTVTQQRRDCDLNPGPTAREFSTLTTRLLSHLAYMPHGEELSLSTGYCLWSRFALLGLGSRGYKLGVWSYGVGLLMTESVLGLGSARRGQISGGNVPYSHETE